MTENLKNKKYLLKISLIWFALTLVAYLLRGLISSEKLLKGLCIETTVVFALVFYHLWKWKGTPFKVVTLFVLMCFLYLQGQVLLDTFDLTKDGLLSGKFSPRELVGGILAVHVFLSLLLTAISTAKGQKRKFFSGRGKPCRRNRRPCGNDYCFVRASFRIVRQSHKTQIYLDGRLCFSVSGSGARRDSFGRENSVLFLFARAASTSFSGARGNPAPNMPPCSVSWRMERWNY